MKRTILKHQQGQNTTNNKNGTAAVRMHTAQHSHPVSDRSQIANSFPIVKFFLSSFYAIHSLNSRPFIWSRSSFFGCSVLNWLKMLWCRFWIPIRLLIFHCHLIFHFHFKQFEIHTIKYPQRRNNQIIKTMRHESIAAESKQLEWFYGFI